MPPQQLSTSHCSLQPIARHVSSAFARVRGAGFLLCAAKRVASTTATTLTHVSRRERRRPIAPTLNEDAPPGDHRFGDRSEGVGDVVRELP